MGVSKGIRSPKSLGSAVGLGGGATPIKFVSWAPLVRTAITELTARLFICQAGRMQRPLWIQGAAGLVSCALLFFSGSLRADVFTVTNTDTSGPGSLLQTVLDANAHVKGGPQTVAFNIPGPGVHKIDLNQTIIPLVDFITIDGYTQPGASPNTLSVGDNAVILIQLDGGGPEAAAAGQLSLFGGNCVIRGLSLTGFTGLNGDPYYAAISFSSNIPEGNRYNRIEGNFIGLEPDGVTARKNDIGIFSFLGNYNTIGGTDPAARNIFAGNGVGILTQGLQTIVGNYFGTDANGSGQGYGNTVAIDAGADIIGTPGPGGGNVITGNVTGIVCDGANTTIQGNLIGPRADGGPSAGNDIGILVEGSGATIGGTNPGEGNVIAFNLTGVSVYYPQGARILSNLFYGNASLDIDLADDGPTANDFGDHDNLQNFPIITNVERNPGETVVSGALNSAAATTFTLQFFGNNDSPIPGQEILGTRSVTTNDAGDATFQFVFPIETSAFITATATDSHGNTSEFFPQNGTAELANISTRGYAGTGDDILIGGILTTFLPGTDRTFLIRALGPSLNVSGALSDPQIDLRAGDGTLVRHNDNWRDSQELEIMATGAAPPDDREPAIVASLPGESYTVQVRGVKGSTGTATVEVYALWSTTGNIQQLLNISTRGRVGLADDVLIGGTILQGSAVLRVIVRAIGPDLAQAGVEHPLPDPVLELRDAEGTLLNSNDDWRTDQETEIIATGLAPSNDRDSAILATFLPTSYTAIVRGKDGATGVGLVEIYHLP